MQRYDLHSTLLILILLGYGFIAGLFAWQVPPWQTPDEPAHYNYIAQIAQNRALPVIEAGDWDQAYLDTLRSERFAPELLGDFERIQYEDHQPPLYYLLATPIYALTDGNLYALRLFSVLIGAVIVLCAYGVGRLLLPTRPVIGLAAAAFVAFQPQHVHILASVNNDALGWALVALTLLATVAYLKDLPIMGRAVPPWALGLLVGLGFMTKSTTYFMAGVVGVALLLRWWRADARDFGHLLRQVGLYLGPALALGLLWWGRNLAVYGFPDFLGLAAHDAVVVGQPRTAARIDALGMGGYLRELLRVTFNSFWGQFGWMGVPMPPRFYSLILALLVLILAGLGIDTHYARQRPTPPAQRHVWIIMGLVALLSVLAFLYYNTEFQQYQGRYMFPLLIPLGLWLALGVDGLRGGWQRGLRAVLPDKPGLAYLTLAPFMALALFDLWLLWRVIIPNL